MQPAMRLVTEAATPAPMAPAPAPPAVNPGAIIDEQLRLLQQQIAELSGELEALRQRDQAVKFYMQRLDEEMRLAARLQQDFLPKSLPQIGRVHFHTLFRPASYVSGDLYDVMRLDEKHVGFYMADAVGHGIPAALLTMFIKNALVTKEITPAGYRLLAPGESLARVNESLIGQNLSYAQFATAIYGCINTETLELSFARGGHPKPVMQRADGSTHYLDADGSLLGIFADEVFTTARVQLAPGDRLLIFSDGVEVAFTADQSVDAERWSIELEQRRHLGGEQLIAELASLLDTQHGSLSPKDDLTIILAEVV